MRRLIPALLCLSLMATPVNASNREGSRLENRGLLLEDMLTAHDAAPRGWLVDAECTVVKTLLVRVAIGIGDSGGHGIKVCRAWVGFDAPWEVRGMYVLGTADDVSENATS